MQVENCVKNRDNYAKAHLESRYSNYLYSYYNHTSHFSLSIRLKLTLYIFKFQFHPSKTQLPSTILMRKNNNKKKIEEKERNYGMV